MTSVNRNRLVGGFEDTFERGQSSIKKSTKNSVNDFAKSTKNQIMGNSSQTPPADQGTNESGDSGQSSDQPQMTDEERVEFLKDLYGKNNNSNDNSNDNQKKAQKGTGDVTQALGVPQKDPNEGKTPEEIVKLEALRKQLHGDYYQDLLNKSKQKEEPVAEKLEREEEEKKMSELEEEKKKPSELPKTVKQGTAESVVGASG